MITEKGGCGGKESNTALLTFKPSNRIGVHIEESKVQKKKTFQVLYTQTFVEVVRKGPGLSHL